ncbi:hypothetical protein Tco_1502389 [Tanacetum coccineum]
MKGMVPRAETLVEMEQLVQNINHSAFRSMFEREKLSGNNFNEWFRKLKLVLIVENNFFIIKQPLPVAPAADYASNVLAEWNAIYDAYNEVACLILGSMTHELHRQFENSSPYDIIRELKSMFEKQAGLERTTRTSWLCATTRSTVGLILNGLTSDFARFVRNYNMHNMEKTVGELHAMLIGYEKGLPKMMNTTSIDD